MTRSQSFTPPIAASVVPAVDQIIRLRKFCELHAISRSMLYLKMNPKSKYFDERLPKPIRLGARAVGWSLYEVTAYLEVLKKN